MNSFLCQSRCPWQGRAGFSELEGWQALRLKKSIAYDCGLVLLNYELNDSA